MQPNRIGDARIVCQVAARPTAMRIDRSEFEFGRVMRRCSPALPATLEGVRPSRLKADGTLNRTSGQAARIRPSEPPFARSAWSRQDR